MAISVSGGNGNGSRRRRAGPGNLAEINVTPFVDVVLVLLIIFMLTAHVMEFGIEVDVPKVAAVKDTAKEMPVVTMTKNGDITLNGKTVNYHELGRHDSQTVPHRDRCICPRGQGNHLGRRSTGIGGVG